MIETMGGRKVLLLLLCIAIAVTAMILKGDVPSGLADFLKYLFGIFVIGNGVEHAAEAATAKAEAHADANLQSTAVQAQAQIDIAQAHRDAVTTSQGNPTDNIEILEKLNTLINVNQTNQQGIAFIVERAMGKK